jgi:hypothetical protein
MTGLPSATANSSDSAVPLSCRSCGTALQGRYCHACGIKAPSLPLTLSGMWQDFTERVLHVERSLKRTVGHLCWQPRVVFTAFLQGQRLKYTHPLPFLVAIATLCVLARHFFGEAFFDAYRAQLLQQVSRSLSPARAALYAQLNVWLNLSMPYWMLIFTLPTAGLMRLAFPKRGFAMAEAWAVGLYGIAMAMLANLLVSAMGQWAHMPLRQLQLFGDALLLLISVGYYLAWLGLKPWTVLRVVAACLAGFVLMNQLQELIVYRVAAYG